MARIAGGHWVARVLKKEGVRYIFTLSGGHISPIYEGCADEGIGIIDVRHEQAAAHAAEGWAKVTRQPGVAVVTAGPGVTDTVTAVVNAYFAPSPMVIIGGRSPLQEFEMGSLQEMDQVELMRPITKWARTCFDTRRIPEYVAAAFRQATSDRPGPAFLEIPMDMMYRRAEEDEVVMPEHYRTACKCGGDIDLIRQAARLLAEARHPVVIAGGAVWWCAAHDALREFLHQGNLPVYLNGMGRGSVPPDDPLFFSLSRRRALMNADVVLVIGTPFDFRLGFGRAPLFPLAAKVIQVDFQAADIGRNRPVHVGIAGDVCAVLSQICDEMAPQVQKGRTEEWLAEIRAAEAKARAADEPLLNSDAAPIHPMRLCRELRDFLDRDVTVVGDGGDIVTFAARVLNIHEPGHWLDPGQMGCLGVGTGFAMAAKLARPNKQVLLVNGDGSFGLNGMEFDTMARHKIPVVSVVGNDGAWGQVKHPYVASYGRALGVDLKHGARYDKMVEALGGHGEFVQRPEEIRPALERAFASGLPACVNVLVDPAAAFARTTQV